MPDPRAFRRFKAISVGRRRDWMRGTGGDGASEVMWTIRRQALGPFGNYIAIHPVTR